MTIRLPLFLISAVALAASAPAIAAPVTTAPVTATPAFNAEQGRMVQCVAKLAIIASEQKRGVQSALTYLPLAESGAYFAQIVGERLMRETGRTKESVRDAFVAAVAAEQAWAKGDDGKGAHDLQRAEVVACLDLMARIAPAPQPPGLNECAAMTAIAEQEVSAREGKESRDAKAVRASAQILAAAARDNLMAQGRNKGEADAELATIQRTMLADALKRESDGVSAGLDFETCFAMADKLALPVPR